MGNVAFQSGPKSRLALFSVPASAALRIDSHHFRVLLLRRLRLSLPQSLAPAGVAVSSTLLATTAQRAVELECWAGGGYALESVGALICRGRGPGLDVFVRDLDLLAPNIQDARRWRTPHWCRRRTARPGAGGAALKPSCWPSRPSQSGGAGW